MSKATENLDEAMRFATSIRPKVGGFPYLAEVLRQAGVTRNVWTLPSCQALYLTGFGPVIAQGTPLLAGKNAVPAFDQNELIRALRTNQAGESTFPEFLKSAWDAGVVGYDVDFDSRKVVYRGVLGETYTENYPAVSVKR